MDEKFLNQIQEKANAEATAKIHDCELEKEQLKRRLIEEKERVMIWGNLIQMAEQMNQLKAEINEIEEQKEQMKKEMIEMEGQKDKMKRDLSTVWEEKEQTQREVEEQLKIKFDAVEKTREMVEQRDLIQKELRELKKQKDIYLRESENTKESDMKDKIKREISKEKEQKKNKFNYLQNLKEQKDQLKIEYKVMKKKGKQIQRDVGKQLKKEFNPIMKEKEEIKTNKSDYIRADFSQVQEQKDKNFRAKTVRKYKELEKKKLQPQIDARTTVNQQNIFKEPVECENLKKLQIEISKIEKQKEGLSQPQEDSFRQASVEGGEEKEIGQMEGHNEQLRKELEDKSKEQIQGETEEEATLEEQKEELSDSDDVGSKTSAHFKVHHQILTHLSNKLTPRQ